MRVLVTGAQGRIGRVVVALLREHGHAVRTFDRFAAGAADDAAAHVPGDLRDVTAVRSAVQGQDAVVHVGAIPSDRPGLDDMLLDINVGGTLNVLQSCAEAGIGRVVNFSSVNALGVVGRPEDRPDSLPFDDAHDPRPVSPYQISKRLGEEACKGYTRAHGMVTLSLRPMWVSYPQDYPRLRRAGGLGNPDRWDGEFPAFVDARDVADATLRCLTVEGVVNDAFLLSADQSTLSEPTADYVARHYAGVPWSRVSQAEWLADDPYRSVIDASHAKEVLGWQPVHNWRAEE